MADTTFDPACQGEKTSILDNLDALFKAFWQKLRAKQHTPAPQTAHMPLSPSRRCDGRSAAPEARAVLQWQRRPLCWVRKREVRKASRQSAPAAYAVLSQHDEWRWGDRLLRLDRLVDFLILGLTTETSFGNCVLPMTGIT
ncbi:Hypothetical predicted protein [Pelobates cultripes]|uniref:Uncharacterized protein n=1 Tax=Pelobates cultripes TaxID=61616 RepID=A0AAD1WNF9_PELCU|nr:Hypothetical predicted protein [Pelobates cultripes]